MGWSERGWGVGGGGCHRNKDKSCSGLCMDLIPFPSWPKSGQWKLGQAGLDLPRVAAWTFLNGSANNFEPRSLTSLGHLVLMVAKPHPLRSDKEVCAAPTWISRCSLRPIIFLCNLILWAEKPEITRKMRESPASESSLLQPWQGPGHVSEPQWPLMAAWGTQIRKR